MRKIIIDKDQELASLKLDCEKKIEHNKREQKAHQEFLREQKVAAATKLFDEEKQELFLEIRMLKD